MTVTDVKSDLHRLVVETDDMDILTAIQQVFKAMQKQKTDWWELLSASQKKLIRLSLEQADQGQLIPAAQVRTRIDNWIKSKS